MCQWRARGVLLTLRILFLNFLDIYNLFSAVSDLNCKEYILSVLYFLERSSEAADLDWPHHFVVQVYVLWVTGFFDLESVRLQLP